MNVSHRATRALTCLAFVALGGGILTPAQALYAQTNYEYPVRKGVALDPIIARSIGELTVDPLPLTEIAKYRKQASTLVDKVGFDQ